MSQIEQEFRQYLAKHPEIEKCYQLELINRRSLARHLIDKKISKGNQLEATIAMLRRFNFEESKVKDLGNLQVTRIAVKDNIIIYDIEKQKSTLQDLQKMMNSIEYDKGDTFKVLVGSSSIKVFLDRPKEKEVKNIFTNAAIQQRIGNISELSILFTEKAINTKGILSLITREFLLNNITVTEFLTASPELLIYIHEKDVMKAYEILKQLQKTSAADN